MPEEIKPNQQLEANQRLEANQKLAVLRHSVSHIMAQAVVKLFPETKVAIGPSIENGFYYDFQFPAGEAGKVQFTEGELPAIEAEMKKIIDSRQDFVRVELDRGEAIKYFAGEPFKQELINDLPPGEVISIYENRDAAPPPSPEGVGSESRGSPLEDFMAEHVLHKKETKKAPQKTLKEKREEKKNKKKSSSSSLPNN